MIEGLKRFRVPRMTRVTMSDGGEYWLFSIPHWWDRRVGWLFKTYHIGWIDWDRGKGFSGGWGERPYDSEESEKQK